MTVVCCKCRSTSLAGLCQHLPSAVSQQYLHVPGLLQREELSHPTELMLVDVYPCVHVGGQQVDISLPNVLHIANSIHSQMLHGLW